MIVSKDFFKETFICLNVCFCIAILWYVSCWKHQNHQVLKLFPFGYLFDFFIILKLNQIQIIYMSKVRTFINFFRMLSLNFRFYKFVQLVLNIFRIFFNFTFWKCKLWHAQFEYFNNRNKYVSFLFFELMLSRNFVNHVPWLPFCYSHNCLLTFYCV
jgi:hypothetical protein